MDDTEGIVTLEEIEDADKMLRGIDPDSVPIQNKIRGFTPVPDSIAKKDGLIRGAVFGKVWRYTRMKDRVCRASLETIADGLGIDRSTVSRHLEALCADKYLKDMSPNLKNKPHVYMDTGKIKFTVNMDVAESNTDGETVAQRNVTVAESRMKKDSKKDSKKEDLAPAKERGRPDERAFEAKFSEITFIPIPQPNSIKEKKTAAERWYQPVRRMVEMADGLSLELLAETVRAMRGKGWDISAPQSIEKTFTAKFGERASVADLTEKKVYR